MCELSIQNIDRITRDILRQEITFSHLSEDLIDHVCCDVEDKMKRGLTFAEAYYNVRQKIGKRRLKEIQEETLYAIDTKYRTMKNTMKISGVAGTVLLGLAALFKIQHWAGAGIMMTLGAVSLAFVFMPSSLGVLWKETHNTKRMFLFISAFIAGIFFIMGTLFKIQHWPGAGIVLILAAVSGILFFMPAVVASLLRENEKKSKRPVYIIGAVGAVFYGAGMLCKIQHYPLAGMLMISGLILLGVIAFPWFTWITWKEESHINSRFFYILIGSLLIAVPGTLINLNMQFSYEKSYYPHLDQQNALYINKSTANNLLMNRYHDSLSYPVMEKLHSKTTELLSLISNISEKMIQETEESPGLPTINPLQLRQTGTGQEIHYSLLLKQLHPGPVRDFLKSGCNTRKEIDTSLSEYLKLVSVLVGGEDQQKYTDLLDPSNFFPEERPEGSGISMLTGLHSLELLRNSLLTVESHILKTIAGSKQTH